MVWVFPAKGYVKMLTKEERRRYSRQITIFGEEGQLKLKQAKVFIADAEVLAYQYQCILLLPGLEN